MIRKLANISLTKAQQNIVNITASVINMLITTLISFCLSPHIVKTIGVEANGFVSLANSFITYMSLASTALNSMASRFIMIAYYRGEKSKSNKYYSSLFFADLVMSILLGGVSFICVLYLEFFLEIPIELISDIKKLFGLLFCNFIISTLITAWNTAPYIKNKLYLNSVISSFTAVIRFGVIVGMFMCLNPYVYYIGVGTLVAGVITAFLAYRCKIALFPDMCAKLNNFSLRAVGEMISSGIWNSISSLGTILLSSLDLLIANVFVGATAMGVLSVAKTMPMFVSSLISTIAAVFTPSLIIDFSQNNKDGIVDTIKNSSKFIAVTCSIPLGFLIVYGKEFYSLWQPTQNAEVLHILSIITIFGRVFFTGSEPLFNIFTVTNKVRANSIVTIVNGVISIIITFIFVRFTSLGVYAIAGVSVVCCFIKNMVYVIPYSAKYLGLKWTSFYDGVVYSVECCILLCILGYIERKIIVVDNWSSLIFSAVFFALIGLGMTSFIVLSRDERKLLLDKLKRRLRR